MIKHIKRIGWLIAALWSVFGFIASNSPSDVSAAIAGWTALLWLQPAITGIASIALNPLVYVASVFIIGGIAGWQLNNFNSNRQAGDWWENLGVSMSMLAFEIDEVSYRTDIHRLNGEIDVVRLKAKKHDVAFPSINDGFNNVQHLLPYLGRVSALLKAGNVKEAKQLASSMSKSPPTL